MKQYEVDLMDYKIFMYLYDLLKVIIFLPFSYIKLYSVSKINLIFNLSFKNKIVRCIVLIKSLTLNIDNGNYLGS